MKKTNTKTHTEKSTTTDEKNKSPKIKHAGGHSFGKSPKKHPLGHLRTALAEDEDCLSRL